MNQSGEGEQAAHSDAAAPRRPPNSMRHDLRTPLNAILGYSDMLAEELADAGHSQWVAPLRQIYACGEALLTLVDRLFETPHHAGLSDADLAAHRDILVQFDGDVNQLIQACEQLLEPLLSLNPEWGADLARIDESARRLRRLRDQIFAPSESAPAPSAVAGETVPVAGTDIPPAAAESTDIPAIPTDVDEKFTETGTILVVDDNAINRDVLARRLRKQGHQVELADSGIQALEMLAKRRFDLVLLDIMMPVMDGYEVLRRLKGDEQLRHLPVIIISALDEMDSVVSCIQMGAEDYLTKPFNPVLLRARIGACLEKKLLRDREMLYLRELEQERKLSDQLLHVILPHEIVSELKANDAVKPRRHENVAVLFADIVGFTPYCERHEPEEVLARLQYLVENYEQLALKYQLEKIKTIGDAFMATAGLLADLANPVLNAVRCGQEMVRIADEMPERWKVRVGIHVGPVVAGVLGRQQFLYDLWGDTVNTAARIESHGVAGAITLSAAAWQGVSNLCTGESLGVVEVKGKGPLEIFRFFEFCGDNKS